MKKVDPFVELLYLLDEELKVPPERKKYCEEWKNYFESHRDIELENQINKNCIPVKVYFPKKFDEMSSLNFEVTYKDDDSFDSQYKNTPIRHLFENGYSFIEISKECNLYRICDDVKNGIIYSPCQDYHTRNKIFLLHKDNKLFYIAGSSYLPNGICKKYIDYVGELGKQTIIRTNIFELGDSE